MSHIAWIVRGLIAIGALGACAWLADVIGDRREARVRAGYAAEIAAANARADGAEALWSAHYQAQLAERIGTLADIKSGVAAIAARPEPQPATPAVPAPAPRHTAVTLSPDLMRRLNAVRPQPR